MWDYDDEEEQGDTTVFGNVLSILLGFVVLGVAIWLEGM